LGIIGGAETRDEAATAAVEAIRFTLEGDDEAPTPDSEVSYVQVALGGVA
jgi:predicted RNase H-like HicB family nuclease